ncbi:hypothetical protein [Streptosporangium jomthongense]|uniref:Uncharacterized protein n=1 Tax=Streptosporangium jomthongense TaxID=1193683 RepID=A0ABV8FDQ5_9ACTN
MTEEEGNGGSSRAIALVPVTIAPVRDVVRRAETVPPGALQRAEAGSPSTVLGPRGIPHRHGLVRVYGRRVPPVAVPKARSAGVAKPPPPTRVIRKERPAPPVRRPVQKPPRPEPSNDRFECPKEWRNTWLWEVCVEEMRNKT